MASTRHLRRACGVRSATSHSVSELHDQLGGRTMLRFTELKPNAAVPPVTFKFTPPAGADVIEDAPAKK